MKEKNYARKAAVMQVPVVVIICFEML